MKSRLMARKITTPRFKLDVTQRQAIDLLVAAYAAEVECRGGRIDYDDATSSHIALAADALTKGIKFGIALCGGVGSGKTTLMAAICNLTGYLFSKDGRGFRKINATDIASKYVGNSFRALCEEPMLAIDDLGCEPVEVMQYGNVLTPTVELLMARYDMQLYTIITTNIEPHKIAERYGERVADRLREMMTIIPFNNKTYRL